MLAVVLKSWYAIFLKLYFQLPSLWQSHAPWTREGKKAIKKLGLTMEYPDGYLEAQAAKKQSKEAEADGGAGSDQEAVS